MTHVPWTWSATGFQTAGRTHDDMCRLCLKAGLAGIEAPPFDYGPDYSDNPDDEYSFAEGDVEWALREACTICPTATC